MLFPLPRRTVWTVATLLLGMLLSMLTAGWLTWERTLLAESENYLRQLAVRAHCLEHREAQCDHVRHLGTSPKKAVSAASRASDLKPPPSPDSPPRAIREAERDLLGLGPAQNKTAWVWIRC